MKYINIHHKKDAYLFKSEFKIVFIIFTPHIITEFHYNTSIFNLKTYLWY